jgi:hypothetical protein
MHKLAVELIEWLNPKTLNRIFEKCKKYIQGIYFTKKY